MYSRRFCSGVGGVDVGVGEVVSVVSSVAVVCSVLVVSLLGVFADMLVKVVDGFLC